MDSFADAFEALFKDDVEYNLTVASQLLFPVIIPSSVPSKFSSSIKVCGIHLKEVHHLSPLVKI